MNPNSEHTDVTTTPLSARREPTAFDIVHLCLEIFIEEVVENSAPNEDEIERFLHDARPVIETIAEGDEAAADRMAAMLAESYEFVSSVTWDVIASREDEPGDNRRRRPEFSWASWIAAVRRYYDLYFSVDPSLNENAEELNFELSGTNRVAAT